jgi:hypothetical protein
MSPARVPLDNARMELEGARNAGPAFVMAKASNASTLRRHALRNGAIGEVVGATVALAVVLLRRHFSNARG